MNARHLLRRPRVLAGAAGVLLVVLLLASCGDGVAGTYAAPDGNGSLELRDNGKAYLTLFGNTVASEYEVDGDKVILKGPLGSQVLTRKGKDLVGLMDMTFTRK